MFTAGFKSLHYNTTDNQAKDITDGKYTFLKTLPNFLYHVYNCITKKEGIIDIKYEVE